MSLARAREENWAGDHLQDIPTPLKSSKHAGSLLNPHATFPKIHLPISLEIAHDKFIGEGIYDRVLNPSSILQVDE